MEDSSLTRRAVEELMMEMDEYKGKINIPTERKKNPLGRPNKLFLGRTINSMMKHNKRQSDRNLQRCERKLKELDAKQRKRKLRKQKKNRRKLESSNKFINSDCYDERYRNKTSKKINKKRKKKYECRSSSLSSTSSSFRMDSSDSKNSFAQIKSRKEERRKKVEKQEHRQDFYNNDSAMGYYVDPNVAYVAMAYSQMNNMMQQQQLIQQNIVKGSLEQSVEIPSDLNLSCHSSTQSSLNISLHSSSAEEDENGIITFKLSSDDEENVSDIFQKTNKTVSFELHDADSPVYLDDNVSIHSHISLESKDSHNSSLKDANEIYSISSSDSEEIKK